MISKSGIRTIDKIEAHNCPILCTCGYLPEDQQDKWSFCGWFGGALSVNADLLVVHCQCPAKVMVEAEA